MSKQIEEVMGLVDALIGKSIGGGLCSIAKHPDVAKQAQDYANAITTLKSSIEAKLRELLPVWIYVNEKTPPACTSITAYGRKYGDRRKSKRVFETYISTRPHECVEDEEISHWMPSPKAPE